MAGYSAMARIERSRPRVRAAPAPDADRPGAPGVTITDLPRVEDLSGEPFAARVLDLWEDIRDVWRQGKEVLADPQGWR